MISKDITENILKNSKIANQLNPKEKKRFVKTAYQFLVKTKLDENYKDEKINLLKYNLATAFAHISIHFENKLLILIPKLFLSSEDKYKNVNFHQIEGFNFNEGVVIHKDTEIEQLYYILCSLILKSYLNINISVPYFSDNLLQLETEIAKSFSGVVKTCDKQNLDEPHNPVHRFAEVSKIYFTNPEELRIKSPSLYSNLEKFWKPDLKNFKTTQGAVSFSQKAANNQGLTSKGKLHFIYKLTILSVFVSSFFTLLIASYTLISYFQILLLILISAITPYLFRDLLKKLEVPIIEIPFGLFSVFGFGMNICLLMLSLNYFILKDSSEKNYFFKSKSKEIIDTRNYYNKSDNILEFEAVLLFPNGTKRTLSFESKKTKDHNFYIITKKGLFGKEVIVKKQTF